MKKGIKTLITASPLIKKPGNNHSASISCQYTKLQKKFFYQSNFCDKIYAIFEPPEKKFHN